MIWSRNVAEYQQDAIRTTLAIVIFVSILKCIFPANTATNTKNTKVIVANGGKYLAMAQQDTNAAYRLKHSAMAVANLETARSMFDDITIEQSTGVDVHQLLQKADAVLERSMNLKTSTIATKLPLYP